MRILLLFASVFFIGLYSASRLLKFIRTTVLNCLSVKRIKWNSVQLKFLENKVAIELTALSVQLVIIPSASASAESRNVPSAIVPNSESRNVNESSSSSNRISNRSRTDQSGQNSRTDRAISTTSTTISIISSIVSVLLTAGKTLLSYLLSCFTIVLTDSILELKTIDGEQIKVRDNRHYVMVYIRLDYNE